MAESSAIWRPSPNFGPRRGGADVRPDLVVIHYTAMDSAPAALERLCDPSAEVSAHYLIGRDGALSQMVAEEDRAWHAGQGAWGAVDDVNSRSIGIELDNDATAPFAAALMDTLEALLPAVMSRWAIPPARVIGHADMAPQRKQDPGPRFDWCRLARAGLAVWPETGVHGPDKGPADVASFRQAATAFGYPMDATDDQVLTAFRNRFRPGAQGPLTPADTAAIADLARRFPVDRAAPAL